MNFDIADYIYELVNGPLAIMNIVMNLFFAFCLSCPARHMKEIQQPLKMLLGSLIFATTVFLLALFVDEILSELQSKYADYFDEVVSFTASTSLSTTVWLNFFYYTQIVPAHEANRTVNGLISKVNGWIILLSLCVCIISYKVPDLDGYLPIRLIIWRK
ncbi:hypothetical protein DPEC_G00047960 [Dallia pectoralis]|uniref:Uncharacterized protein n=1 Tax=Dallia pectoralis TaxID=75939 RepID=A0ACC2HAB4_DALPE|nr:hypothetical protein DPEC_G00047960 [Dallia pectoralis]